MAAHRKYFTEEERISARRRRQKEWRIANAEKEAAYRARPDVKEKLRQRGAEWRRQYPDRKRDARYRSEFGISLADYNRILANQGGGCAICRGTDPIKGKNFHVDHDHKTGKVRGLLCHRCNLGIGQFHDDPDRLSRAASYLNAAKPGV